MANENVNIELVIQAGRSATTLGEVKQSIKDVNAALKDVQIGTEEWKKLHEVFLQNRAVVKSMRQEFAGLKQIEGIGKAATASFAAATASIQLFANGNEELEKGLRKTAASLELMLAVKELARSMRELQIANEGVNKSLLTNPYVLLATVVLSVGAAFLSTANDGSEMGSSLNDLKSQAAELKPVWEVLKEGVKGFLSNLVGGTAAVFHFIGSLAGLKGTSKEAREAEEQLKAAFAQSSETIKNNGEELDRNLELYKSASQDKIAIAKKEQENDEKKLALAKYYQEEGKKLYEQYANSNDEEAKKFKENYNSVTEKVNELTNKIAIAQNNVLKLQTDAANETAQKAEKAHLKDVVDGYNDIATANQRVLELMKERGEDEEKISQRNLSQNAAAAEYLREEIATLQKKKKLDDDQKQTLEELLKLQSELGFQKDLQQAKDEKAANDKELKSELQFVDQLKTKYEALTKTLDGKVEAMKADGTTEDKIWNQQINNINQLTQELNVQMAIIQTLNIGDAEKIKLTNEYTVKLAALQGQMQKVNGEMTGWNKKHVFTPTQQKEVQQFEKGLQALGQVWGKVSNLITTITDQQSQKRIAIYEAETNQAMGLLDKQLQYGYVSQAQYNIKKQQLDQQLADEKKKEEAKQFKEKKAMGIVQATIDTALSVTEALSSMPPPAAYIMAAVSAAMGAVEIATIAAQSPPAMATGGLFTDGGSVSGYGSSTSDSVNAHLSNGEGVINARSTKKFAPLLSAINQLGGGVAFSGQPKLQPQHTGSAQSPSQATRSAPQKVYVTEYDITRTQNKVAVIQNRSTF